MVKSFDSFYDKVTNKTPLPTSTNPRDEAVTLVNRSATEIIQEMLANESDYFGQLTIGIQTYMAHDTITSSDTLRENVSKIFGNIQQIRDFHENTFHSALKDCGNDITKIANVFSKFAQVQNFQFNITLHIEIDIKI